MKFLVETNYRKAGIHFNACEVKYLYENEKKNSIASATIKLQSVKKSVNLKLNYGEIYTAAESGVRLF